MTDKKLSVGGIITLPRLLFSDFAFSAIGTLPRLGIELQRQTGAFWNQCLTRGIEDWIARGDVDWILTFDYDTVFSDEAVLALVDLAIKYPEIDAFAALQSRRDGVPLFYAAGFNPSVRSLKGLELIPVDQAHFGLTLLRLSCFAKLEKPWFIGQPDPDGGWRTGRVDDDITFWQRWKAAGCSLALALRSVVGHSENMIIWPDKNMRPIFQFPGAFWESNCRPPSQTWGVGEVMPPILPAERPVNEALQAELQSALTEERSR